jgi:hypothetical protein
MWTGVQGQSGVKIVQIAGCAHAGCAHARCAHAGCANDVSPLRILSHRFGSSFQAAYCIQYLSRATEWLQMPIYRFKLVEY